MSEIDYNALSYNMAYRINCILYCLKSVIYKGLFSLLPLFFSLLNHIKGVYGRVLSSDFRYLRRFSAVFLL